MTATAEKLAHETLDLIPHDGVPHLAADGDPQPRFATLIVFADDDEVWGMNLLADSRQSQELRSFSQAGRFRKCFPGLRRHSLTLKCAVV